MPNQLNEAHWVSKKAKTLTDTGDTVQKALKVWDTAKADKKRMSPDDFKPALKALAGVKTASEALLKKANPVMHRDTIALLKLYIKSTIECYGKLDGALGRELLANFLNLPKPIMTDLRKMNPALWDRHAEHLEFMQAMKSSGGKGTQKIYDTWLKKGVAAQVNIAETLLADIKKAYETKPKPILDAPCWKQALTTVQTLMKNQMNNVGVKSDCATFDKTRVLALLRAV